VAGSKVQCISSRCLPDRLRKVDNIFANANMLATRGLAQNRVPITSPYSLRGIQLNLNDIKGPEDIVPPVHKLQLFMMLGGNRSDPGTHRAFRPTGEFWGFF
jgi:hypothetical protein